MKRTITAALGAVTLTAGVVPIVLIGGGAALAHHTTIECVGDTVWSLTNSEAWAEIATVVETGEVITILPNDTVTVNYDGTSLTVNGYWPKGPGAGDDQYNTSYGEGDCTSTPDTEPPVETTEPPTDTTEVPDTTEPPVDTEPPVPTDPPSTDPEPTDPEPTDPEPTDPPIVTTTTVAIVTVPPTVTVPPVVTDPVCEYEVPEGADYRDGFWYDADGRVIGEADSESDCVEFHDPVDPTPTPLLPATR